MFDKNLFRAAVVAKGKTMSDVADEIHVSNATMSKKVNGHSEFTRKEIQEICDFLEVDDPVPIFFAERLA